MRPGAPVLLIFMGLLDQLTQELTQAKAILEPQIEGLHDFSRLNLKPETQAAVATATTDFQRRLDLINAALTALGDLGKDGYPTVPKRDVIQDVFDDLQSNVKTIEAAFAEFEPIGEATQVIITPGTPTEKP